MQEWSAASTKAMQDVFAMEKRGEFPPRSEPWTFMIGSGLGAVTGTSGTIYALYRERQDVKDKGGLNKIFEDCGAGSVGKTSKQVIECVDKVMQPIHDKKMDTAIDSLTLGCAFMAASLVMAVRSKIKGAPGDRARAKAMHDRVQHHLKNPANDDNAMHL